jgi:molybdenum cofactor guanylyltransferase
MSQQANITGLILAGGRGSRMGGADKGLQLLHGTPLVAHVLARLAPQVGTVLISANRNTQHYARYAPVVADTLPDFAGPLAGILAALQVCTTPLLLTVPCDAPALPADLAATLLRAMQANNAAGAYACVGTQPYPTVCLLQASAKEPLRAALHAGQRKVLDVLATLGAVPCDFAPAADAFANINDTQALAQLNQAPQALPATSAPR